VTDKIKPVLLKGFQDFLPKEMIVRQRVFSIIQNVCEKFGFDPLDTPSIEKTEILTGNSPDFDMLIYRTGIITGFGENKILCQSCGEYFPNDKPVCPECGWPRREIQDTALRFDLTVPLARVVAANQDLPKPFKRYQTGKVWRGEKPQAGRYREFAQFDVDIVGSDSMLADTEIVNLMYEVIKALGFDNFVIRINNRKILNGLAEYAGFKSVMKEVLRVLDKLEKVGTDKVKERILQK